jgi:hypothetical protein
MIFIFFSPESPRWLKLKGKNEMALASLKRIRRFPQVEDELDSYDLPKKVSLTSLFRKTLIRPIVIVVGLSVIQQFSGVNVIFSYSTGIFEDANIQNPAIATAIVGLINVVMSLVAV